MFKITPIPASHHKFANAPWSSAKVWQPIPEAFVVCVTSESPDLLTDALTDGVVLYSPWGDYSKVEFKIHTEDLGMARHFFDCRVMDTIEEHDPDGESKYWVIKVLLPEDNWSQEQEDHWVSTCTGWVYSGEWRNSSPLAELNSKKGN